MKKCRDYRNSQLYNSYHFWIYITYRYWGYEDFYSYESEKGFMMNITFTIDLSSDYVYSYDHSYDENGYIGNTDVDEYYYISLYKKGIYYQSQLINIDKANIIHDGKLLSCESVTGNYDASYGDFRTFDNNDFHYLLLRNIQGAYVGMVNMQYLLVFIFDCVILPLLLSFIYFLMFKRNGRMKKFTDYYKIASIAIILPTLIVFTVTWFFPPITSYLYILSFGVWYLIVCYKVNSIRDLT